MRFATPGEAQVVGNITSDGAKPGRERLYKPATLAGAIVQCLIPVQLARFVVIPIAQALNIYGRQDLHLAAAALGLAATAAAFALGAWLGLPLRARW